MTREDAELRLDGVIDRNTVPLIYDELVRAVVAARETGGLRLDLAGVERIDSAGVSMFASLLSHAGGPGGLTVSGANAAVKSALELFRWEEKPEAAATHTGVGERVGHSAVRAWRGFVDWLVLACDTLFLSFGGSPRTRRVRRGAVWTEALRMGADALPIVGLIAFLIGVVVALQSASQLRQFGASIYVANLIAISMTREMGPLMTAIIIAGRSGASIAAEVATMKVSEEVDALRTMGLSPIRYIVVPKFQAMTLTMPCLTVFANFLGIFGGFLVGLLYLDLGTGAFWRQVDDALVVSDITLGLVKSLAFAWIIVLLAAYRGFQAHGGAESVGRVTTSSVVSSIFWVIVADAVFSMVFYFGD